MNKIVSIACVWGGLLNSIVAQTQLQYQLNQQGNGSCSGSTVTLSVSTSVNITTAAVSEISSNAATTGGNITNDGGNPVTQRGVCWSTAPNPTTNGNITNNGNGLGSFTSNLSGLAANTTYFIRAYAVNSAGTFYGNELSFTTANNAIPSTHSCGAENVHNPNLNYGSMTDQDGNVYKTIVIGNQEWMAENLSTAVYRNGDSIPALSGSGWPENQLGAYYNNNGNNPPDCPYGKLYNWYAVADPRGLCPAGWHVPSDEEWNDLIGYLDNNYLPNGFSGSQSLIAGEKLKSSDAFYWSDQNIANNESGFSALPAGWCNAGSLLSLGNEGFYWSSTSVCGPCTFAWFRSFYDGGSISKSLGNTQKPSGFSVRCLRDNDNNEGFSVNCDAPVNEGILLAGVPVSAVTSTISYTGSYGHTYNGQSSASNELIGLAATWEGIIADGSGNITIEITGTPLATGSVTFDLLIRGQTCSIALNILTAPQAHTCGAFNVHNPAKTYGSMSDQQGNSYKTIVIGNQEWMAENLKTTVYRNGDAIPNISDANQWGALTSGGMCSQNNNSQYECPYGKLYNWYAVADPRNVCPTGWHVPTYVEWLALTNYLGGVEVAGDKMKSEQLETQYWFNPNTGATNESGFSGLPGGFRFNSGEFSQIGGEGAWWSSNSTGSNNSWSCKLGVFDGYANLSINDEHDGLSIRCLRD
jgi:uncharacterized protein (TIGR02145 family)